MLTLLNEGQAPEAELIYFYTILYISVQDKFSFSEWC